MNKRLNMNKRSEQFDSILGISSNNNNNMREN